MRHHITKGRTSTPGLSFAIVFMSVLYSLKAHVEALD